MKEWKKVKFLDYIELNPKVLINKGEICPFIEMANVDCNMRQPRSFEYKPFTSGVKFQTYDTVIARIEPCLQNGKGFLFTKQGVGFGSTEYLVFRAKPSKTIPLFVYYFMRTHKIKTLMCNSMSGATGRQRVNNDVFLNLEVDIPSYDEQQRIATILSRYDSLIENYQKQIKLLEESAQRLYKEWLIDLRFPGHENVQIVDGVPEGWEKKKVGDLISKVRRTKQVSANNYLNSGCIPVIDQSRNYIAGYTNDIESLVEVTIPYIVFGDHTRVLKYVPFSFAKGADGTQLIMSNDLERMPQSLFYNSLIEIDLSNYSYARHFKYLKEESILVPSKDIAQRYDKVVSQYFQSIQKNREQIHLLTEARDRLLPKLMSGKIEL